jgi:predicted AAA+ superfamily ATPase
MIEFTRAIEKRIESNLFKGNIIAIFGPRQAGKTTLSKKILKKYSHESMYFDCQIAEVRQHMIPGNPDLLYSLVKDYKLIVLDEAQSIQDIGLVLKVFHDRYPDIQIIATGSSSFDLANKINEPLTGRIFEYTLLPLSVEEIQKVKKVDKKELDMLMIYGSYPAVVVAPEKDKREILQNLATNYLYKDVFMFETIKNPRIFEQLVELLAHQAGNLVSIAELASSVGVGRGVIQKYIRLLEQSFIIKILYSYSTNQRSEIKKRIKIHFYDTGVRNALVDIKTPLNQREDRGLLWENFFVAERIKKTTLEAFAPKLYFWSNKKGLEIDLIEKDGPELYAFECKWRNIQAPFVEFLKLYPKAHVDTVSRDSFLGL